MIEWILNEDNCYSCSLKSYLQTRKKSQNQKIKYFVNTIIHSFTHARRNLFLFHIFFGNLRFFSTNINQTETSLYFLWHHFLAKRKKSKNESNENIVVMVKQISNCWKCFCMSLCCKKIDLDFSSLFFFYFDKKKSFYSQFVI